MLGCDACFVQGRLKTSLADLGCLSQAVCLARTHRAPRNLKRRPLAFQERNRRALQLLVQKDESARELEAACAALRAETCAADARAVAAEAEAARLEALLQQEATLRQAAVARAAAAAAAADALERRQLSSSGARPGAGPTGDDNGHDALLQEQARQLLRLQAEVETLAGQLQAAAARAAGLQAERDAALQETARHAAAAAPARPDPGLARRLQQLEDENARLLGLSALAESDARASAARACAEAGREAGRLRQALAERDAEVAGLASELAVVRAGAEAAAAGLQRDEATAAQLASLKAHLADREAAVRGQAERLAELEFRAALAAEGAAAGEARLREARQEAEAARAEARAAALDAEVARTTTARFVACGRCWAVWPHGV
jgi:hypothetical protein